MEASDSGIIRWGIIGTANIAKKNSRSIIQAKNCELIGVASRSSERARSWAQENNLSASVRLYGTYEAILNDPAVQAIYLPLPTKLHLEWVSVRTSPLSQGIFYPLSPYILTYFCTSAGSKPSYNPTL